MDTELIKQDQIIQNTDISNHQEVEDTLLRFIVNDEEYAVPIVEIKGVISTTEVVTIPLVPKYIAGILNLRGQVLTVFDLRIKLNSSAKEKDNKVIMIYSSNSLTFGLIVDSVDAVLKVKRSENHDAPDVGDGKLNEYINGFYKENGKIILGLDILKLLKINI